MSSSLAPSSPSSLRLQPNRAATAAPVMAMAMGIATTITTARRMAQPMSSSCPDVGPGFHLHQRTERELGDADGGAGGPVVAEQLDVHLVHAGVVAAEVLEEHRGLGDVGERGALRPQEAVEVGDRLPELTLEPPAHELPVGDPHLA